MNSLFNVIKDKSWFKNLVAANYLQEGIEKFVFIQVHSLVVVYEASPLNGWIYRIFKAIKSF